MSELLIGTDNGIFRLGNGTQDIQQEAGPLEITFLVSTQTKVFALTRENALWMRADNNSWKLVNERSVSEEVWAFAADPRMDGRLYLGVSPALLYRSDDGGESWTACESMRHIPGYETWTFPPPPHIPHVRSIAPDPQVIGAVYVGVEEGGVFYSRDGGETWESLNEGLYWDVHVVNPATDGVRLYAVTGSGFHRSDDGGHHWQCLMAGLERRYTTLCVTAPKQPERLYTAAAASPPPGWVRGGANAALYRSEDGGDHWVRLEHGLPPQFDVMVRSLTVDANGIIYAAAGQELFKSADGGDNWQLVAGDLPTVRALAAA
ncbi:MAG: hypothetical protein JOZ78_20305 [Chroococcidiopsidaceae cyanobacterium CP_BM_ER_R8_30]|nr:hypothetical protein [Chroococcidiopsidaceae cyanobacterium CP_BM_ER_R8_30]